MAETVKLPLTPESTELLFNDLRRLLSIIADSVGMEPELAPESTTTFYQVDNMDLHPYISKPAFERQCEHINEAMLLLDVE